MSLFITSIQNQTTKSVFVSNPKVVVSVDMRFGRTNGMQRQLDVVSQNVNVPALST